MTDIQTFLENLYSSNIDRSSNGLNDFGHNLQLFWKIIIWVEDKSWWTNDIRRVWKISQNGKSLGDDEYTVHVQLSSTSNFSVS